MYTLEINHLDVGQGDCCVIYIKEVDEGHREINRLTIVVDCGSTKNNFQGNDACVKLEKFLSANAKNNLPSIEYCIVTHYDGDHLNGIQQFVSKAVWSKDHFNVLKNTKFYDRGDPGEWGNRTYNEPLYNVRGNYAAYVQDLGVLSRMQNSNLRRVTEKIEANSLTKNRQLNRDLKTVMRDYTDGSSSNRHGANHTFTPGNTLLGTDLIQATTWLDHNYISLTCLAVNSLILDKSGKITDNTGKVKGENTHSIGLLLKFGNFTYWLGGELDSVQEERCMQAILARCPDGRLSGAKAGHHGSRNSTSVNWLTTVRPKIVCISCGEKNKHGHPHVELLNILENSNDVEKVYLTGYGGKENDLRNPAYYAPFEKTSKFRFCGSDLDMTDGDIRIGANDWENSQYGQPAVFYVNSFQQNYSFAYQERNWEPQNINNLLNFNTSLDNYTHPRSLYDQNGNLKNSIHETDDNTGNVKFYVMLGGQKIWIGSYIRGGDSHQDNF